MSVGMQAADALVRAEPDVPPVVAHNAADKGVGESFVSAIYFISISFPTLWGGVSNQSVTSPDPDCPVRIPEQTVDRIGREMRAHVEGLQQLEVPVEHHQSVAERADPVVPVCIFQQAARQLVSRCVMPDGCMAEAVQLVDAGAGAEQDVSPCIFADVAHINPLQFRVRQDGRPAFPFRVLTGDASVVQSKPQSALLVAVCRLHEIGLQTEHLVACPFPEMVDVPVVATNPDFVIAVEDYTGDVPPGHAVLCMCRVVGVFILVEEGRAFADEVHTASVSPDPDVAEAVLEQSAYP